VAVYLPGVYWLARATGMSYGSAVMGGVLPFLLGDALKVVVAATVWLRLGCR